MPAKKKKGSNPVEKSARVTLYVPTKATDPETGEASTVRTPRDFTLRWNKRALFRMSSAGFEGETEGRGFAFIVTLLWACLDIAKRPDAEALAEYLPEDEEESEVVVNALVGLIESSDTGKKN